MGKVPLRSGMAVSERWSVSLGLTEDLDQALASPQNGYVLKNFRLRRMIRLDTQVVVLSVQFLRSTERGEFLTFSNSMQ